MNLAKIYVGNLPYTVSEDDLREYFSQYGEICDLKIITEPNGRSKGFGFISYTQDKAANDAISATNGAKFHGRMLKVNLAKAKTDRERGNYNRDRFSSK